MGQVIDRTVVLGKRWTDGELLVLFTELGFIVYLVPVIGVILGFILLMMAGFYAVQRYEDVQ